MARTAVAYLSASDQAAPFPSDLKVLDTIRESEPGRRRHLGEALSQMADRDAATLLVQRLAAVAASLGELMRLLDWLEQHGASLVACDVELDTATPAGRSAVRVLREIHRWSRQPEHPRRPPGRPGLEVLAPHLVERIAQMRERGLSLRAIAATLNSEGVATPRGGATWRPSSVQAALGYRRPGPPIPGLPRHHPPPPGGEHSPPQPPPARTKPGRRRTR